ncbi:helicase-related protein [Luteolibacter flavescens]|uniref:Helicase-related protein n=1 Tax=Luteolibacter flavescens TaxID=1859460 RepID=A0ABT3FHP7_9BACT|nr:helicase-related protein [Luteolibacter flavescens]MCW1883092.1 helicase-related protein [Luteolibacter flavescens]
MSPRPDTASVIAGLKDFQRSTVEYVFDRFYGEDPTRRFLVADEVGLGKTLVARGVIARAIDHLWETVERIDVIYVCSNADIARQNVQRLGIPGCNATTQSTRLTLLPLQLQDLRKNRVNFIALTPGTSFDQNNYGGTVPERVLLYSLLDEAWNLKGSRRPLNVLCDYASVTSFEKALKSFDRTSVNRPLAEAFIRQLAQQVADETARGVPNLRTRFEDLLRTFHRNDITPGREATVRRTRWIGNLRRLLARVCLNALEPDLIIFDEFQRFNHLLNDRSEAGELAQSLFESEAGHGARLLLLSATPYKSLSLHHEQEDDQFSEFSTLLSFLERSSGPDCSAVLEDYRSALPSVRCPEGLASLKKAKDQLQERLRKVMARTEKLANSTTRAGMFHERESAGLQLKSHDVRAFLGAQKVAEHLEEGDVVDYWKSAPYLFNFMDTYALKSAFKDTTGDRDLIGLIQSFPESFLPVDQMQSYKPVDPSNPRLRGLLAETVDRGMWRLLWLPPSLSYYEPAGPYADPALQGATKRLVFSAWHVVPKAVSALVSYEAERRMMRSSSPKGSLTAEILQKKRGLLRFGISAGRLTGLPLMGLVYPCITFARELDPRDLARTGHFSALEVLEVFESRLKTLVESLAIDSDTTGNPDERWYWIVPMLLDFRFFPKQSREWWKLEELSSRWAGAESAEEDAGWSRHVQDAKETVERIRYDGLVLGPPPPDLFKVLALIASAGPATAALRALARVTELAPGACLRTRISAAQAGRAFLTLFNHVEVTEMVRAEFKAYAYWRRVLEYSHAGQLQAVLDEYSHVLRESLGGSSSSSAEVAEGIAAELIASVTLRVASLRVDRIDAPKYAREVKVSDESMRIRFAMRFGDERRNEELGPPIVGSSGTRKERVRGAFNSPFWPFVLVSTSVGQEGLDFHHYCHAITHWNLPANPVDLEQREGRVHRYKGHAIRKNLASAHGLEALARDEGDAWNDLFALARSSRGAGDNDLVPYWHYPGEAMIERHVPALPFSREVDRLSLLRKSLALYRLVLGQSRQEDLIAYLLTEVPEAERAAIITELRIDLSPPSRNP